MYDKHSSYLQDAIEEPFGSTFVDDVPIVDEIPGSITLWEVTPRPSNSSDVSPIELSLRTFRSINFLPNSIQILKKYILIVCS